MRVGTQRLVTIHEFRYPSKQRDTESSMFRKSVCFLVSVSVFFIAGSAVAAPESAQSLVKKADAHRGLQKSFSVQVRVVVNDGREKSEQVYKVRVKDFETSLVEQIEPVRAQGRKLLMKGLDMWLFTPQVKKAVRISLQQRLTGDVANGDISRTNYADDYSSKIAGQDASMKATILELRARDKRVTYHRVKYWIETASQRPLKSEFYALSGKLLKTATFSDFKQIDGLDRMTKVTIQDAVVKSKTSTLIYTNHRPQTFSDSEFNKEQMDR